MTTPKVSITSPACRILILLTLVLSTACARNPDVAKRAYLKSGDTYFADKKYNEAILQYRNAVQQDPRFGEAHFKLAETYARVKDGEGAYREYIRAADLMPGNVESQLKAAEMLLLARRFEDARSRADWILANDPKNLQAQILRGTALANLKDLDSAIAQIEDAIRVDPERSATYDNLGALKLAKGNKEGAEDAFTKAVQIDAMSVPARLALATFYLSMRRGAEAEGALKHTLQLDPSDPSANRMLALFYLASNRPAAAEPYLKTYADVSKSVGARLSLADYYVLMNRASDAIDILNRVDARDVQAFTAAQSRVAAIEYRLGRKAEGHKRLNDILVRQPKYSTALVLKARFLQAEHQVDGALAQAKAATEADPTSVQAHFQLGKLYAVTNQLREAENAFNEVLRLNPRAIAAQLELSRVQLAAGNTEASIQTARQVLNDQPGDPAARLLLARGLIARRQLAQAEVEMNALLAKHPNAAAVNNQMGVLALAKDDRVAAKRSFERALWLDSHSLEALTGLVSLDLAAGKTAEARARVEAKLEQSPNDPRLLQLAASAYAATGDPGRAEQTLQRAIGIDPADLRTRARLGQLLMKEGKLESAKAEFDALAKFRPNSHDAIASHTTIAQILEAQHRPGEAQNQYEQVLAASPRTIVAANNLAWLYAERGGNLDVALGLAQTAAQQAPDRPEVNDTLGWIYYKKDLAGQAIAALERCVAKDTTNPLYYYHLGLAYTKRGDRVKAKQSLERALTLKADFDGSFDARKVLASIGG